jgi:citrate lyase subunit beta / citryl-CoA lyase
VVAARAAGLPSPVQSVWTSVGDLDGLRHSTVRGRDAGFFGRSVVHPSQLPVVNEVFTPSDAEVRAARTLVDEVGAAEESGHAAYLDGNGRLVDPAVVARAMWTLALVSDKEEGT